MKNNILYICTRNNTYCSSIHKFLNPTNPKNKQNKLG